MISENEYLGDLFLILVLYDNFNEYCYRLSYGCWKTEKHGYPSTTKEDQGDDKNCYWPGWGSSKYDQKEEIQSESSSFHGSYWWIYEIDQVWHNIWKILCSTITLPAVLSCMCQLENEPTAKISSHETDRCDLVIFSFLPKDGNYRYMEQLMDIRELNFTWTSLGATTHRELCNAFAKEFVITACLQESGKKNFRFSSRKKRPEL